MDRNISRILGAWTAGIIFFAIVFHFLMDFQLILNSVEKLLEEIHRDITELREFPLASVYGHGRHH